MDSVFLHDNLQFIDQYAERNNMRIIPCDELFTGAGAWNGQTPVITDGITRFGTINYNSWIYTACSDSHNFVASNGIYTNKIELGGWWVSQSKYHLNMSTKAQFKDLMFNYLAVVCSEECPAYAPQYNISVEYSIQFTGFKLIPR